MRAEATPSRFKGSSPMERDRAINDIFEGKASDFSSRFISLARLHERLKSHPEKMDSRVINDTRTLLLKRAYDHQRQGYFLYREAAETLVTCTVKAKGRTISLQALQALLEVLRTTSGDVLKGWPEPWECCRWIYTAPCSGSLP